MPFVVSCAMLEEAATRPMPTTASAIITSSSVKPRDRRECPRSFRACILFLELHFGAAVGQTVNLVVVVDVLALHRELKRRDLAAGKHQHLWHGTEVGIGITRVVLFVVLVQFQSYGAALEREDERDSRRQDPFAQLLWKRLPGLTIRIEHIEAVAVVFDVQAEIATLQRRFIAGQVDQRRE